MIITVLALRGSPRRSPGLQNDTHANLRTLMVTYDNSDRQWGQIHTLRVLARTSRGLMIFGSSERYFLPTGLQKLEHRVGVAVDHPIFREAHVVD